MYEEQTNAAVALLKRLIATPSVSRDESAAADIIEEYLREKGLEPKRHANNVWVVSKNYDEGRPTLLLNAHIDTVRPVNGWQHDPFTPVEEDGRIYGLGSNDCGGGLVTLLHVFLGYEEDAEKCKGVNLVYLASAEEEVSGKNGIECVLPLLPKIDFAIVGEPTGMQPAIAEKGLMVVDAVAHGKSGHAARNEGVNAIYKAMDDVAKLRAEATSHELFPKVSDFLGAVKTSVTIIQAGTQHNVVPDTCTFTIDVRSNELYSNEEIFEILCANLTSELKARSFRLSSSCIEMEHPLVKGCTELGLEPFGSPTLSDQALMKFPSLKLGPGQSSRSHTADEYICVSEIADAFRIYDYIIGRLSPLILR